MRPTLLNFRSPNERTPEYYNVKITNAGEPLHFRSKSLNKKLSNLPQAERFPQYKFYQNSSGLSCFVGPGTYNDQDDYLKLTSQPCSIKMKKISVIPEQESGKPCYIMIGNNLKFEASFLSTREQKQEIQSLNTQTCPVYLKSTLHKRSVSNIKDRLSFTLRTSSIDRVEKQDSFSLPAATNLTSSNLKNYSGSQTKPKGEQNSIEKNREEGEQFVINSFQMKNQDQNIIMGGQQIQRPMTCQNCNSNISKKQSSLPLNSSANATLRGKLNKGDFSNTIGGFSSNMDKSTTLDMNSMKQIQEEGSSLPEIQSTPGGQDGYLSEENQIRIKSMLPKTAVNFSKMKKGLYLNPIRGYPYNLKEEALARSINILQAYHEIIPALSGNSKRGIRSQKGARSTSKRTKQRRSILSESANMTPDSLQGGLGQGTYMNVIRDSPSVVNQREQLEKQKRDILNMKFNTTSVKKKDSANQEMNKFLSDRYSSTDGAPKDEKSESGNSQQQQQL